MSLKPTMMLLDGHTLIDLEDPDPKKMWIEDIAAALSRIKRWNGRGSLAISVAQHSVYVSMQLPPQLQLAGLLHDAHKAFTGEVTTPVKRLMRSVDLHNANDRIDKLLHEGFGVNLTDREWELVKQADLAVCAAEMYRVFGYTKTVDRCLKGFPKPAKIKIACWTDPHAKNVFLQEFYRLTSPDSDSTTSS